MASPLACEMPRIVDASELSWDDTADVVVIGFGAAGASAAIEARERGADVLAVDRFAGGGATAYSGGVIYAGGTHVQRECGIEDTPEEMFRYLSLEWGNSVQSETLRRYCEGSAGDVEWLESHGVPFGGPAFLDKTGYPPEGSFLYFSGNEKMSGYREVATPAPRGHRTVGAKWTGHVFYERLKKAALGLGVRLLAHSPVRRLVIDGTGRVLGVEILSIPRAHIQAHQKLYAEVNPYKPFRSRRVENAIRACREMEGHVAQRKLIRARRGIVIATGGFSYNLAMLAESNPLLAENHTTLVRLGSMGCDGSGIDLGRSVGGTTKEMDSIFVSRTLAPPSTLVRGILVNSHGKRFVNEESYGGFVGIAIARQPNGSAYLIIDKDTYWRTIKECFSKPGRLSLTFKTPALLNLLFGGTKRASTIAELAGKVGIDSETLSRTVRDYNKGAKEGVDVLGKSQSFLYPAEHGPFYAIDSSITNKLSVTMMFTLGGLAVDEETGRLKRADGTSIEGLFAAGRAASGLCARGYLSGTSIGDCVFSGRRAARHIMEGQHIDTAFGDHGSG